MFTEQVVRPTGLIDPICQIRKASNQVEDIIDECRKMKLRKLRCLITTLTKKDAEKVSEYLNENDVKAQYMHSDIEALERIELIKNLRLGNFDVLVGINLLREGLDIPECGLVAILDADKEGFLRSHVSLIQTIGRAARNVDGRVILYADHKTESIVKAINETTRRRIKQIKYNQANNIVPRTTTRKIEDTMPYGEDKSKISKKNSLPNLSLDELKRKMLEHAENLEFEKAAELRDKLKILEKKQLGISD